MFLLILWVGSDSTDPVICFYCTITEDYTFLPKLFLMKSLNSSALISSILLDVLIDSQLILSSDDNDCLFIISTLFIMGLIVEVFNWA